MWSKDTRNHLRIGTYIQGTYHHQQKDHVCFSFSGAKPTYWLLLINALAIATDLQMVVLGPSEKKRIAQNEERCERDWHSTITFQSLT